MKNHNRYLINIIEKLKRTSDSIVIVVLSYDKIYEWHYSYYGLSIRITFILFAVLRRERYYALGVIRS